jgi:hypothetical protein
LVFGIGSAVKVAVNVVRQMCAWDGNYIRKIGAEAQNATTIYLISTDLDGASCKNDEPLTLFWRLEV